MIKFVYIVKRKFEAIIKDKRYYFLIQFPWSRYCFPKVPAYFFYLLKNS